VKTFLEAAEYESTLRELGARVQTDDVEQRRRAQEQISRLRMEAEVAKTMSARGTTELHPEVMAVGLSKNAAMLALPGEFFAETGLAIKEQSGLRHLQIACYANHYIGYVVPAHATAEGGYEPGISMVGPDGEAIVRRTSLELLSEVTG
jgi:hypothetical protein